MGFGFRDDGKEDESTIEGLGIWKVQGNSNPVARDSVRSL